MTDSLFGESAPPTDVPPGDSGGDVPRCTECGKDISYLYGGRGRKPTKCEDHKRASSTGTTRTTRGTVSDKELSQACDSLRQLYDMLTFPIAALNPDAGGVWLAQVESLDARNRTILANNRDLVRKINSAGEKSGTLAFVMSHAVAVVPVGMVIIGQARMNAAARREAAGVDGWQDEIPAEEYAFAQSPNGVGTPKDPTFFDVAPAAGDSA